VDILLLNKALQKIARLYIEKRGCIIFGHPLSKSLSSGGFY